MSLHPNNDSIVATGGADKKVVVYDRSSEKIVSTFEVLTSNTTLVLTKCLVGSLKEDHRGPSSPYRRRGCVLLNRPTRSCLEFWHRRVAQ